MLCVRTCVCYSLMYFPLHIPSFLRVFCGHSLLSFLDISPSPGFKNALMWRHIAPFSCSLTLSSLHIPPFNIFIFLFWHQQTYNFQLQVALSSSTVWVVCVGVHVRMSGDICACPSQLLCVCAASEAFPLPALCPWRGCSLAPWHFGLN